MKHNSVSVFFNTNFFLRLIQVLLKSYFEHMVLLRRGVLAETVKQRSADLIQ
jgi:hypothetical protein